MVITFAYCIGNVAEAITPTYGFAYIDTFYEATHSKGGTTAMAAILILIGICATIANVATASRQMYAFARDKGLPFSNFLCKVSAEPCTIHTQR